VRTPLELPDNDTLNGKRGSAILQLQFYTGCRVAEVTTLKVADFFEDGGYWVLDFRIKGNDVTASRCTTSFDARSKSILMPPVTAMPDTRHIFSRCMTPLAACIPGMCTDCLASTRALPSFRRPHSARATFNTKALDRKRSIEAVQKSVGLRHISTAKMYDKRKLSSRESASFVVQY